MTISYGSPPPPAAIFRLDSVEGISGWSEQELSVAVSKFMTPRYYEGYINGVQDHDAALIFRELINLHSTIGLLTIDTCVVYQIIEKLAQTSKLSTESLDHTTPETTAALVMVLETQTKILNERLIALKKSSDKHSEDVEALQTAINRSLWFQRELVSRFLKEERKGKKLENGDQTLLS